eukprot:938791-Pleurochrysis_carterae.AAC.2
MLKEDTIAATIAPVGCSASSQSPGTHTLLLYTSYFMLVACIEVPHIWVLARVHFRAEPEVCISIVCVRLRNAHTFSFDFNLYVTAEGESDLRCSLARGTFAVMCAGRSGEKQDARMHGGDAASAIKRLECVKPEGESDLRCSLARGTFAAMCALQDERMHGADAASASVTT